MTAQLWPAAFREPIALDRPTPSTPPAGLPELGDVARYRDTPRWGQPYPSAAWGEPYPAVPSSSTTPRPYVDEPADARVPGYDTHERRLQLAHRGDLAPSPVPRPVPRADRVDHTLADVRPIAPRVQPDAATRIGTARSALARMRYELEQHGLRALARSRETEWTVQTFDPVEPHLLHDHGAAQGAIHAYRVGLAALEVLEAALLASPGVPLDLPAELRSA